MGTMLRTGYPDFFESRLANLHTATKDAYARESMVMPIVFFEKTSDRSFEKISGVSSLGQFVQVDENETIPHEERVQLYDKEFVHVRYGLAYKVGKWVSMDDLDGLFQRNSMDLGASANETVETIAANHLNRAFNSNYTGPDGKVLCATDHPLAKDGGTFQNRPTTHVDLSVTALDQMFADVGNWKDAAGKYIKRRIRTLVVPTELYWLAERITRSPQLQGTANNDITPGDLKGLQFVKWEHLTDTDAWFGITDKKDDGLIWFWRQKFQTEDQYVINPGYLEVLADFFASSGWVDPRVIYGSSGA